MYFKDLFKKRPVQRLFCFKIIKVMQLTAVVLLVACLQVSAASYAQKVTLSGKDMPLHEVFNQIRKQTGYNFIYANENLAKASPVTIHVKNVPLKTVLNRCFAHQPLTYKIDDKIIIVKLKKQPQVSVPLPVITTTGVITDSATGNPLVGVSIKVKGTTTGTITDATGHFSLDVPDDAVLVVSSLGYTTKEVLVNGRTTIPISLSASTTGLNQLVVVGYGTQKKKDVTGAIASLDFEDIQNTPVKDVLSAMQGRLPGVQIMSGSGAPGDAISVVVRGQSTLNAGNSPLYIVDGIPIDATSFSQLNGHNSHGLNPLSYINPSDIASIEVLKDAASTAIYGSRAANGVVIITTKKGKSGKARISLNAYTGVSRITRHLDVLNANQWRANVLDAYHNLDEFNDAKTPTIPYYIVIDSLNPMNNGDVDWQSLMYRVARQNQLSLSVSGGDEDAKYALSSSYLDEDGIFLGSNYKRLTSRLNTQFKISPKIKVGYNIMYGHELNHRIDAGGTGNESIVRSLLIRSPVLSLTYPDGSPIPYIIGQRNLLNLVNEATFLNKKNRLVGQQYIALKIIDGLKLRSNINLNFLSMKEDKFLPTTVDYRPGYNSGKVRSSKYINWSNENYLTYNHLFTGGHRLSAMVGFSMQESKLEVTGLDGKFFASDRVRTLNGAGIISNQQANIANSHGLVSYFGRIGYNYNSKYIIHVNFRADGSSRFGTNRRFGFFPSASAAWRFSDEPFLDNLNFISSGKIRISAGQTGNEAIGIYTSQGKFAMGENYLDNSGAAPTVMPNEDLTWETTTEYDVGIDLSLFNYRVAITADVYIKNTTDLLFAVPIPWTTGFSSITQNLGKIQNKGFELAINTQNLNGEFKWNTGFNISLNRNKVVSLPDQVLTGGHIQNGDYHILAESHPVGIFYGYKFEGVFATDADNKKNIRYGSANGKVFRGGDPIWDDVNGDRIINAKDRQIIGNAQPAFIGGLKNDFSYKNFSLSIFYQFSYGNDIYSLINQARNSVRSYDNVSRNALDRWRKPGDITNIPRPIRGDPLETDSRVSDRWIFDGTYLKLKTVRLSYAFPDQITDNLNVSRLRLYISGQNLLTWTKYTGYDPDVNSYSGTRIGIDAGAYPQSRTFIFGLDVEF